MGLLIPASRADTRRCSPKLNTGRHSFRVFEEPLLRLDRLKTFLTPSLTSPAQRETTCSAQSRCGKCTTGTETYFRGSDAGPDAGRSASEEVAQGHLEPDSAAGTNPPVVTHLRISGFVGNVCGVRGMMPITGIRPLTLGIRRRGRVKTSKYMDLVFHLVTSARVDYRQAPLPTAVL